MSNYDRQSELDDELLSAYLDDELSPEERAAVEARLAADPSAQQLLHQLRAVCEAVQALPQEVVGHDMRESILDKAQEARQSAPASGSSSIGERADAANGQPLTALDDAPKFTFGRTRRGWVWASLAIAASLLIMVFGREPGRDQLPVVAQNQDRLGDARGGRRNLEFRAVNEPSAPPAESDAAPPPDDLSAWAAPARDLGVVPAPSAARPATTASEPASGAQPRGRARSLDLVTESPPPPAPTQMAEEAGRHHGVSSDAATPMNVNSESLKEEVAEMAAADGLAAAAPTSELRDIDLGNTVAGVPAGGEPAAETADESQPATGDPLVVVRVHAKRTALETRTFDQLLERSGIEVEPEQPDKPDDSAVANYGESRRAARRFSRAGQTDGAAESATDPPAEATTVDAVLVEASPAAIVACMDGLNKDQENFLGLVVDATPAVGAKPAADAATEPQVFAKLQLAENLELTKYNRGIVPPEQESLARDRYDFYRSGGANFGGGRFDGAATDKVRLELLQQGRLFSARKALSESDTGLAVRLKAWGSETRSQPQSIAQQVARGGVTNEDASADSAAAVKRQELSREMKEAEQRAVDNKLQVLFLFSSEEAATAPAIPASRGKAQ